MLKQMLITLAIAAGTISTSYGQFPGDSVRFHAKASVAGAYLHGNVNQTRLIGTAQLGYNSPSHKWNLGETFNYNYLNDNRITRQSDIVSLFVARYRINPKLYPIGILWGQTNKMFAYKGIAAGAGYEWLLLKKPRHFIAPSLVAWYEWVRYDITNFKDDKYDGKSLLTTPRLSLRFLGSHEFPQARIKLSYNMSFMQSLRWSDNYRIFFNPALEIAVYKGLSVKLSYLYTYESAIIANRVHDDHAFTYGLTYDIKS